MANPKGLQRAYKRIRNLAPAVDVATAERTIREEIARFGEDPMLLSMLASVIEPRLGIQAAIELHTRAATAAPETPSIVEDYAACQERGGNIAEASAARFSLHAKGIRAADSMLSLAWTLLRTRSTLTGDRIYTPADFYRLAMAQSTDPGKVATNLGDAMSMENRGHEIVPIMRDALVFDPAAGDVWYVLGIKADTDTPTARRLFDRAIRLKGHVRAMVLRALSCGMGAASQAEIDRERCQMAAAIDAVIARPELRIDIMNNNGGFPYPLFYLAYHAEDDRPMLEKIARMFRQLDPGLVWQAPHVTQTRASDAPISIGIVGSFGTMSIYLMMVLIANNLDTRKFNVTLYSYDNFHPEVLKTFSGISTKKLDPVLLVSRNIIASAKHDIIMYTDLFMNPRFYFLAFARLARHQMLWPGHPVTSGLDTIDYFVSTETLEREGADIDYSEKLIKLPELCTLYPSIEPKFDITTLESFGIDPACRVYMCAQTLYKVHHDFDWIVARILEQDPQAVVVLFKNPSKETTDPLMPRIRALTERFGDRLRLFERLEVPRFLGLMNLVDVLLDTLHFSGGNTSFQAFQMGVPVVTLPGKFMRGRGTYSLYKVMGFEDLVASDMDDYVALALRVAQDREFRARCVAEIESRRHRLFERPDVAADFARMFEDIATRDERGVVQP